MSVVLRAAVAYWLLLLAVRLIGRRTASQMAPFDLIVLFLFGGSAITSVLGEDHSIVAAYTAICTIGIMHIAVSWLKSRSIRFDRFVDGTPVVVFEHGQWHEKRMRWLRLGEQDVLAAARQRGLRGLHEVYYAVAERDGKVSIIERRDHDRPTPAPDNDTPPV
ncbi:DUF421 domain-containing protein [Rhizosaccharibacter radicis]|uniref:DUF421 domain-containing protein n=1 Tax=Rhizosaccharibacter radicis TaxID=2782605 RepID=A0ABT1VXK8_9PROT|nr:DUF421 domain-containing protein [Acetobacteraceae bacterium KSS12]